MPTEEKTMRLRFRKAVTIAGVQHTANSVDTVPQGDEAWNAVNCGDADLDPAPGLGNPPQPFPPEYVQRSEATEAPLPQAPVFAAAPAAPKLTTGTPPARTAAAHPATPETVGDDPHTSHHKGKGR